MKKNCAEQKRVGRKQFSELNFCKFKKYATENAQCPQKKTRNIEYNFNVLR